MKTLFILFVLILSFTINPPVFSLNNSSQILKSNTTGLVSSFNYVRVNIDGKIYVYVYDENWELIYIFVDEEPY